MSAEQIPHDVWAGWVLLCLKPGDVRAVLLLSKGFRTIASDNTLWQRVFRRQWGLREPAKVAADALRETKSAPTSWLAQFQAAARFSQMKPVQTLREHSDEALCVVWSQDGRFLASTGKDSSAVVYELDAKSADGKSAEPQLRVLHTFELGDDSEGTAIHFSSHNPPVLIVSTRTSGSLDWGASVCFSLAGSGRCIARLRSFPNDVNAGLLPDGRHLVTCTMPHRLMQQVHLWRIEPDRVVELPLPPKQQILLPLTYAAWAHNLMFAQLPWTIPPPPAASDESSAASSSAGPAAASSDHSASAAAAATTPHTYLVYQTSDFLAQCNILRFVCVDNALSAVAKPSAASESKGDAKSGGASAGSAADDASDAQPHSKRAKVDDSQPASAAAPSSLSLSALESKGSSGGGGVGGSDSGATGAGGRVSDSVRSFFSLVDNEEDSDNDKDDRKAARAKELLAEQPMTMPTAYAGACKLDAQSVAALPGIPLLGFASASGETKAAAASGSSAAAGAGAAPASSAAPIDMDEQQSDNDDELPPAAASAGEVKVASASAAAAAAARPDGKAAALAFAPRARYSSIRLYGDSAPATSAMAGPTPDDEAGEEEDVAEDAKGIPGVGAGVYRGSPAASAASASAAAAAASAGAGGAADAAAGSSAASSAEPKSTATGGGVTTSSSAPAGVSHLRELELYLDGTVLAVSFSPDYRYMYANIRTYPFHYDPDDLGPTMLREEISTFTLPDSGSDQEFIDALPISDEIQLRVYDVSTPDVKLVATFMGHEGYTEADGAFFIHSSCNGPFVASGGEDKKVHVWHREHGFKVATLETHRKCVNSVAFNPVHRSLLASASDDHSVVLWRA